MWHKRDMLPPPQGSQAKNEKVNFKLTSLKLVKIGYYKKDKCVILFITQHILEIKKAPLEY